MTVKFSNATSGQALQGITGFGLVTAGLERLVRCCREIVGVAVQGNEQKIEASEPPL